MARLQYRVLGPVEVLLDGRPLPLSGGKQRALLAVLLARANEVVLRERLIDELWPEEPPEKAAQSLQMHVSRLRKSLGLAAGALQTRQGGYLLLLEPDVVDLTRLSTAVAEARRLLAAGDASRALRLVDDALALWRGEPFANISSHGLLAGEAVRASELKAEAESLRIDVRLALGGHDAVIGELRSLVQHEPLRERPRAQLMVALYRAGRQADALALYRETRRLFVDELGIEPGEQLRRLEGAILRGDPLALPAAHGDGAEGVGGALERSGGTPRRVRSRRRAVFAAAALVLAAGATTVGVLAFGGRGAQPLLGTDVVGILSAESGAVERQVPTSGRPTAVAVGAGTAWVTDAVKGVVREISLPDGNVLDSIPVGADPDGVTVGAAAVWVANGGDRTVSWVDPAAGRVVKTIAVGNGPAAIVSGAGSVWVVNQADGTLQRIDMGTGRAGRPIAVAPTPSGLTIGSGSVWVADRSSGSVVRFGARSGQITNRFSVGNEPTGLAYGGGYLWVANASDGTVTRLDPASGAIRKILVGKDPEAVAYAAGVLWVAERAGAALARIDTQTLTPRTVAIGSEPVALAAGGGRLWVATLAPIASHRGGTLRLLADRTLTSIDPSSYYPTYVGPAYFLPNWQVVEVTNDGLVAYRKVDGVAGATVVPDLATSIPAPAHAGRTYTFQLRAGIRYSTGRPVRASDFRYSAERQFRAGTPGIQYTFANLVDAAACLRRPAGCRLTAGITTDDAEGTVTYHLVRPDPAFLYELALPFGDVVPPGSPAPGSDTPVAATGPYEVASFKPGRQLVLVRNPRFRQWSADAQPDGYPDRLQWTLHVPAEREVTDVEHGRADIMLERVPADRAAELRTRYASLAHPYVFPVTHFFFLNTRVPPFNRLSVRRALNLAVDRARKGDEFAARPTCQVLPPNMPGYRPYCPYTVRPSTGGAWNGPDLARARHLVAASGTRGMSITVWADPSHYGIGHGRYLARLLDRLGYRAHYAVRRTNAAYFTYVDDSANRAQIGNWGWIQDYPNPIDFFAPTLSCSSFLPRNPNNLNVAEFCNRTISREIQRASVLQQTDPVRAATLWSKIDRQIVDQAPWAALTNEGEVDLLSSNVGNYEHSPQSGLLIDQLWVK